MRPNEQGQAPLAQRIFFGSAFAIGLAINVLASIWVFFSVWWYCYDNFGLLLGGLLGLVPAVAIGLLAYTLGLALSPFVGLVAIGLIGYGVFVLVRA